MIHKFRESLPSLARPVKAVRDKGELQQSVRLLRELGLINPE
jgi:hypothetical protein